MSECRPRPFLKCQIVSVAAFLAFDAAALIGGGGGVRTLRDSLSSVLMKPPDQMAAARRSPATCRLFHFFHL